jgi:hypothetical protein
VLVVRSIMTGFPLFPWLPWKSRLDLLCPSDTVGARRQHPEVGSWHKVDPRGLTLTHMHSTLPPCTCHATIHLACMVARTTLPCAACTHNPSSLPSHILRLCSTRSWLGATHSLWAALVLWRCLPHCRLYAYGWIGQQSMKQIRRTEALFFSMKQNGGSHAQRIASGDEI